MRRRRLVVWKKKPKIVFQFPEVTCARGVGMILNGESVTVLVTVLVLDCLRLS